MLFLTDQTIQTSQIKCIIQKGNELNCLKSPKWLAVSTRHSYMFSAGDDKQVIREYHSHLSGVYCLALHPTIDVLLTDGCDSICRAWDIRSKTQIHVLSGHGDTDPQVITGSHDSTVKFWDLRNGDNGSLWFWDWKSGHSFQQSRTIVQPGMHLFDLETPIICLIVVNSERNDRYSALRSV
ncbi:putative transcription factor WD40-like family [Helianthus annuus]|nr:putative transcription factor WD40-like family [Helianthus annuus]